MELKYLAFLIALHSVLLRAIARERRDVYRAEEPDGSWCTNNAHELETWAHRFVQPQSVETYYG